jgi:hypothetical protein
VADLPVPLRDALRDVAYKGAQAGLVSQLAVVSPAARASAAATLPAPVRAARVAKAKALRDMVAAAHAAAILDVEATQHALLALCALETPPPRFPDAPPAADEAEEWRTFARVTTAVVEYHPSGVRAEIAYIGVARARHLPGERLDCEAARRAWCAERFAQACAGGLVAEY